MFNGIGWGEILVILAVALVVLGPDHLPKAMRTLGRTVGQARKLSTEFQRTLNMELDPDLDKPQDKPAVPAAPAREASVSPEPPDEPVVVKKRPPRRAGLKKKNHSVRQIMPVDPQPSAAQPRNEPGTDEGLAS